MKETIASLGLGMSDLQKVMKIDRELLLKLLKDCDTTDYNNNQRLSDVLEIAKEISTFNSRPIGRIAKTHLLKNHDKTYFEYLCETKLDPKIIIEYTIQLSKIAHCRRSATRNNNNLNDIDNITGSFAITRDFCK